MKKYKALLSPFRIGNHIIKNRLLYPNASPHTLQGPETFPADEYRAFYAGLARNGAGIVTIAEWDRKGQHNGPAELDFTHMQSFDLTDPSTHNYFSLMAEDIHFYGSKLLVCAEVQWPDGYSLCGGRKPGPPAPGGIFKEDQPIAKEEIEGVVNAFVKKMRLYRNLGYDGMTMRCDMEILPKEKTREDEYGGASIENRSRFIRQIYRAVKEQLGPDFITEAQIAWEQPWGYGPMEFGGVSSDEVMEFCKLIDADVDIFQIREHDGTRSHPTGFNFKFGEHPTLDFAVRMKKEGITAYLEPIGGFQEPDEMEQDLLDGKCDLFGVARAFMADPEYGLKMKEGRAEDITPCLKCNKCHGTMMEKPDPWITMCSVNPKHGLEHELHQLVGETHSKKVAVIGGGCAGMRAAIIASERGHKVTLFEQTNVLGGQLLHADYFDFKWPLKNYKDWLIREIHKAGIEVHMNTKATPQMIQEGKFDAVLAAVGAVPKMPHSVKGLFDEKGQAKYRNCDQIWGKESELGDQIVIVGGSEAGIETAIYLLRAGHGVTMLTRQSRVAHDASRLHYITSSFVKVEKNGHHYEAAEWERYDRFKGITNVTTKEIEGNVVTYEDSDGMLHKLSADDVLICGGHDALIEEAFAFSDAAAEYYAIGDCNGARNVQACNRQAFARASIL